MEPTKNRENELNVLRKAALELLDWTLQDLSPAGTPLTLRCGIEREGHLLLETLPPQDQNYPDRFQQKIWETMRGYAQLFHARLTAAHPAFSQEIERIYHDAAGTFLIEATTRPSSLLDAAQTTIDVSSILESLAREDGNRMVFGTAPTGIRGVLESRGWRNKEILDFLDGELYSRTHPESGSPYDVLVGRGQHANVSLWLGNANLFAQENGHASPLMTACGNTGAHMLRDMAMPCRHGNYDRIADKQSLSIQFIDVGKSKHENTAICGVTRHSPKLNRSDPITDATTRLEFRIAASEADPMDVALAAGAPLVKTLLECCALDDAGKLLLDDTGRPTLSAPLQAVNFRMPASGAEAAQFFNRAGNTYFTFLDTLAARKIAKAEAVFGHSALAADGKALQEAKHLAGLGTRMHALYCAEYGLESAMAPPGARVEMIRAAGFRGDVGQHAAGA